MSMPTHRFRAPSRAIAWVLIASLLTASCATRSVPPIGADGKPFKPESDEVRLWAQAEKEEEALAKKAKIYDDPLLEEYLGKVGDRLLPDEVRAAGGPGFRFGVMSDPTLNAFAMPNGRVYVHSGLLSRLDNEAQLAMILGHEMTHVTSRHALRFTRDATNKQILFTVLAVAASIGVAVASGSRAKSGDYVGAAVLSQTANAILGIGLQLAAIAAINGYGRDLEREADQGGMEKLVRAGYDPNEAPKVFQLLLSESKDRGSLETFFFGSHPKLQERITTTTELVNTQYAAAAAAADRVKTSEEFGLRIRTGLGRRSGNTWRSSPTLRTPSGSASTWSSSSASDTRLAVNADFRGRSGSAPRIPGGRPGSGSPALPRGVGGRPAPGFRRRHHVLHTGDRERRPSASGPLLRVQQPGQRLREQTRL